jgi:hypothetical protein
MPENGHEDMAVVSFSPNTVVAAKKTSISAKRYVAIAIEK